MIVKSESAPGQFSDAIKKADPRSQSEPGSKQAGIDHGHHDKNDQQPAPALWPQHLLMEGIHDSTQEASG